MKYFKKFIAGFISVITLTMCSFAFASCGSASEGLVYMLSDDGEYYILAATGACEDKDVVISSSYNHKPVREIGENAFADHDWITSVTIPNSVTHIGAGAFSWCVALTSITIPDSVTSIEKMAFNACTALTSITLSSKLTTISESMLNGCESLTNVTIPGSVTEIGRSAFNYCASLTSVTIPDSVTSVEEYAFMSCISLTNITIPDSVTEIGAGAFLDCTSLTSVIFENTEGWTVGKGWASNRTALLSTDLADPATAALYLVGEGDYVWSQDYYSRLLWLRQ